MEHLSYKLGQIFCENLTCSTKRFRKCKGTATLALLMSVVMTGVCGVKADAYRIRCTPGTYTKKVIDVDADIKESTIKDTDSLQYCAEGNNYRYAITADGKEVIAFLDSDGALIDVLQGAGNYVIRDESFYGIISEAGDMEKFVINTAKDCDDTDGGSSSSDDADGGSSSSDDTDSEDSADEDESITVYYKTNTGNGNYYTTYIFHDNCIEVIANAENVGGENVGTSFFQRTFLNDYYEPEIKENTEWQFPENGDFPYKDFDSIVTTHYFDNDHKLYTFFKGEEANNYEVFENYSYEHFPLQIEDGKFNNYSINYTLVFERFSQDNDPDYLALFKGKDYDFAAGITPFASTWVENSMVFTGQGIRFNINITDLTGEGNTVNMKCKIYDYYGKVYGEYDKSSYIYGGFQSNHIININRIKTGMYYVEIEITNANNYWHEILPFAYIPEYDYENNDTSPFGVSGVRFGEYQQNDTTVALMDLLGMANVRVGISKPEYVSEDYTLLQTYLGKLKDNDVNITGQYLLMNDWSFSDNGEEFKAEMDNALGYVGEYLNNCEVGNETNLYPVYDTKEKAMYNYIENEFLPGYYSLNAYDIPIIASGVYQSEYDWFGWMSLTGVWNYSDVLSTHAYSFPHRPDYTKDASILHSYESALSRTVNALNTYGDKTWYISETGYPTTPLNNENMFSGVDLRTQADYTVREFILGLAYGADVVESYGFYDQVNLTKGTNPNNCEYHYGMFYDQDYYGRVMPKPLAAAYAMMTRQLDGIEDCSEIYVESDTLRLFKCNITANESNASSSNSSSSNSSSSNASNSGDNGSSVYVMWSNISPLSNDCVDGTRTPNLPWENQWSGSEEFTIYTTSDVTVTDIMGNATTYSPDENGTVTLEVTGAPIYVEGDF